MNNIYSDEIVEQLQKEIEHLQEKNASLKNDNAELMAKINWFEEQYRLNKHRLFGCSSEKSANPDQISIFSEAELLMPIDTELSKPVYEEVTYKRKKRNGHREEKLDGLPEEIIEYKLSEEEQVCKCCSGELHEMSTETRRELKVIPAQIKVIKHIRYVYSCRYCENNDIKTPVVTASMPKPAIPGSIASASTIAYIMVQKYMFGLPLYRQEQQWRQMDIEISRQTMANWVIIVATRWLILIYNRMQQLLIKRDIIHADETTIQVLHEPGRISTTKSYMWLYRSGRDGPQIVLFEYQTTRASTHPKKFLEKFKGYLCVDGYNGYHNILNTVRICCFSHARRKFDEALKALPKDYRSKDCIAQIGLDYCNKLFKIERELKEVSNEDRYNERLKRSKPLLDEFYEWLKNKVDVITPKSTTGKAVQYCLNLWNELSGFLLDGRLYIDNNISERSIKNFVISRKNFLFCNTPAGANASAIVYSIIQTARENNLKPFEYINFLLEKLPNSDINNLEVLDSYLPWSEKAQLECGITIKEEKYSETA